MMMTSLAAEIARGTAMILEAETGTAIETEIATGTTATLTEADAKMIPCIVTTMKSSSIMTTMKKKRRHARRSARENAQQPVAQEETGTGTATVTATVTANAIVAIETATTEIVIEIVATRTGRVGMLLLQSQRRAHGRRETAQIGIEKEATETVIALPVLLLQRTHLARLQRSLRLTHPLRQHSLLERRAIHLRRSRTRERAFPRRPRLLLAHQAQQDSSYLPVGSRLPQGSRTTSSSFLLELSNPLAAPALEDKFPEATLV